MENSRVSLMFMVINKITMDREILITSSTSSRAVGRGRIRNRTITTTNRDTALFNIRRITAPPSSFEPY